MKEAHRVALKKLERDEKKLEETLTAMLKKGELAFDELLECCTDQPPIKVPPQIIFNVGLKFSQGKDGFEENTEHAFKLYQYAMAKGDPSAYVSCGHYYNDGRASGGKNHDKALECFLKYQVIRGHDRNMKIKKSYIYIAQIYFEKNNFDEAFKFCFGYFDCAEIKKEDKDSHFNKLINCLLNVESPSMAIDKVSGIKDFNWEKVLDLEAEDGDENGIYYLAKLLLMFPEKHPQKEAATKKAILFLQQSLDSLYPKVDADSEQVPAVRMERMSMHEGSEVTSVSSWFESKSIPAWRKNIGGTLLDGYSKSVLDAEINALKSIIDTFDIENKKLTDLEQQLLDAYEDGGSPKEITALKKAVDIAKKEVDAAETKKEAAEKKIGKIRHAARRKELAREYAVQRRFFDPARTRESTTKKIAKHLQENRLIPGNSKELPLERVPTRRIITAERSTIEASKRALGLGSSFNSSRNQMAWIDKKQERVKLQGTTVVSYSQNPGTYPNHLGNYFIDLPGLGSGDYRVILSFLETLAGTTEENIHIENEKKIANFMLRYAKTGQPVNLEELQALKADVTLENMHCFNAICYHVFVKEVARRMPCGDEKYEIPASIIQARAVRLISQGHLTLKDVFSAGAPYGVVTGSNLYNQHTEVIHKINRINKLYNECIYKRDKQLNDFFKQSPDADIIASRHQLREELRETFGGGSDTEGDGYSSSEEDSIKKSV